MGSVSEAMCSRTRSKSGLCWSSSVYLAARSCSDSVRSVGDPFCHCGSPLRRSLKRGFTSAIARRRGEVSAPRSRRNLWGPRPARPRDDRSTVAYREASHVRPGVVSAATAKLSTSRSMAFGWYASAGRAVVLKAFPCSVYCTASRAIARPMSGHSRSQSDWPRISNASRIARTCVSVSGEARETSRCPAAAKRCSTARLSLAAMRLPRCRSHSETAMAARHRRSTDEADSRW